MRNDQPKMGQFKGQDALEKGHAKKHNLLLTDIRRKREDSWKS